MSGAEDSPGFLGKGIYSVPDAARLTQIPARRIRRWLRGYHYTYRGERRSSLAVWTPGLPAIDGELALSFRDLMEARFVDAFREHHVSWKVIRTASGRAAEFFGETHPFSTKRFRTDGRTIFADLGSETGDRLLLDLVKNQYAFRKVLDQYLYAGIEFSAPRGIPLRWWPNRQRGGIVLDPARCFGKPILAASGVQTSALAAAVAAEGSLETAAQLYEVPVAGVRKAVEYEQSLAA